ncbi:hypothetical protein CBOM_00947 [Ceraceosorus bombacis]|uniref:Uncharacterized protein n=1 Tax=Ceraceosorus bombacis TaxID=401625 RepID=A0A0P1BC72_9BASI|nr:hypothetical protein CBOM_00947 [Ceraceosorus bombacis]
MLLSNIGSATLQQWQYGDVSEPGPRTKEEFEREQATLISAQQPEVAQGMIEQNQAQTNGSTSPVVGPSFVRTTIDLKPPAVDRSRKREQSSADSLSSAADTDDQGFVVEI